MRNLIFALIFASSATLAAQEAPTLTPRLPVGAIGPAPTQTHDHDHDHQVDEPSTDVSPAERLRFLLSGYHYFPTQEDLLKVAEADEVAGMLRTIAQDIDERPTMRMKALDALMYFNDAATLVYVEHIALNDPAAPEELLRTEQLMQHHAIMTFAKLKKKDSVPSLEKLLSHNDIQVQMTAISALGKHGGQPGLQALKKAAPKAELPAVKREFRKYVKF